MHVDVQGLVNCQLQVRLIWLVQHVADLHWETTARDVEHRAILKEIGEFLAIECCRCDDQAQRLPPV